MKFLCVTCDEPMKLKSASGPDAGSLTAVFACEGCGWEMAMLTNPFETQVVTSLGVSVGGRTSEPAPMETMRGALEGGTAASVAVEAQAASGTKCPFAAMVAGQPKEGDVAREVAPTAAAAVADVPWSEEAARRITERVPDFVQPMARIAIERYAREKGYPEITPAVMDEAKRLFMP